MSPARPQPGALDSDTLKSGIIKYGHSSLSDVLPSVLASLGVPGERNVLNLTPVESTVVLLVDGMGWQSLREHADRAPFLSSLAGQALTAGFPTTTAASITSLGTGLPSGQHGITGYTTRAQGQAEAVNWLTWRTTGSARDISEDLTPEQLQPRDTAFQRAETAGVHASVVSAPLFRDSAMTRAGLRGGEYVAAFTAADTAALVSTAARTRPGLIYCYTSDLDLVGHVRGVDSESWRAQLELIDRGAQMVFDRLPGNTRLLVTADHGMLDIAEDAKIDYDGDPRLSAGIDLIAGESRVRYLYVAPGAAEAVRDRWTQVLGDRVAMVTREEAIDLGWFGPAVTDAARYRIGDLIALAVQDVAVVRRQAESGSAALIGHHGGLTDAELLVPLLSTSS